MKSFIKFFICGIFFFSLSSLLAQQPTFSTKIIYFPDSSYLGYPDTFSVSIKNMDTITSYSGFVNIYVSTDTIAFSVASLCSIPQIIIPASDSITITCNINFDSTYFNGGNNIVVVWSSGNAIAPADSFQTNVYLKTTGAGVHETNLSSIFTIYPTLAKDFIMIESSENILPKKIFIEDVTGRIISAITPSVDSKNRIKINTSELNSGIYFLDMLLPDKQRIVSKFVKTD